jgi:S-disulfanyl-L-cysteine oxidoreductase SoxD
MFTSLKYWATRAAAIFRTAVMVCTIGAGLAAAPVFAQSNYSGIGRPATAAEVAAWDIDVRADLKGLPPGSGSVSAGQDIWEAKCASCHGFFGESNQFFSPLVGGTTAADLVTGNAKRLQDPAYPGRTTLMKLSTLSTLWDYIHRAMPWTQPKTLTHDEVYAVTAFMLNLGGVVPDDFVLSNKNMAQVQAKLPNRNGMVAKHGLWPGGEFGGNSMPDTRNIICMNNCANAPRVASSLPDFARNAHGNLALQNRLVGPQRGANTELPEDTKPLSAQPILHARAAIEPQP